MTRYAGALSLLTILLGPSGGFGHAGSVHPANFFELGGQPCVPDTVGICDCSLSTVPNLIATPDGSITTVFLIISPSGPLADAEVMVCYPPEAQGVICWCTASQLPPYVVRTDDQGRAFFNIRGGGCIDPLIMGGDIDVFVNGILIRQIGQVSPDIVRTAPAGCEVSLADAVNFTSDLASSQYNFCHDLNSDGIVSLADAVIFTGSASLAISCQ
jgi:hypothetical protein